MCSKELQRTCAKRVVQTYVCLKRHLHELELQEGILVGEYIESKPNKDPWLRPAVHQSSLGFHVQKLEYIPLDESEMEFQDGWVKEDAIDELHSDQTWRRMRDATEYLLERHNSAIRELKKECQGDTKQELLEPIIAVLNNMDVPLREQIREPLELTPGDNGFPIWSQRRDVALAEMVGCSKQHAKDVDNGRHKLDANIKQQVATRDNDQCVRCGYSQDLVHHHIILASNGGSSSVENVALLCKECHKKTHGRNWHETVYESVEEFWRWAEEGSIEEQECE